jgi:hypothetical protein
LTDTEVNCRIKFLMGQNCDINVNDILTPNGTLKKIMKSLFNLMVPLNINGGLILIMKSALNI